MKYVHVKCLQGWLESHLKKKRTNNILQYSWKKIDCELCKQNYKSEFILKYYKSGTG
jgi:E3 ubiquitin-protein ligase DOA10